MQPLFSLILSKTESWVKSERENPYSTIKLLIEYIEKKGKLREPQREAINVYLWLKFVGKNKNLFDVIKEGKYYIADLEKEYLELQTFGDNYIKKYLYLFARDNDIGNLKKHLNDKKYRDEYWESALKDMFNNFHYPNYLYSLPMGSGKTFLMACFIYIDLYFSSIYSGDKRFASNFIVLAPTAAKTAILPSLITIRDFNPEWILPERYANELKQLIKIEVLDAVSSDRKDKLQGSNINLEMVNRIMQCQDKGIVFITNAEKVILDKFNSKGSSVEDASYIEKTNELRNKLSQLQNFTIILDEVHHAYNRDGLMSKISKTRETINILNCNKNVNSVIGMSGTPYINNKIKVTNTEINLKQIHDTVYDYNLSRGIGVFLKTPVVIKDNSSIKNLIGNALSTFFRDFDFTYSNKTRSKIAFYCPSIDRLNEEILPIVKEWYIKNRSNLFDKEVFKYYSEEGGIKKEYKLPRESESIFKNLDDPLSEKRVILLVGIGKEGWDCRSLTSVCIPRETDAKSSQNFVLQASCRCLREADNASKEKALIYLNEKNYETLDEELKKTYSLNIRDFEEGRKVKPVKVQVRKPKLGKLSYNQIEIKFLETPVIKTLKKSITEPEFEIHELKRYYPYNYEITESKFGNRGLTEEKEVAVSPSLDSMEYSFNNFIYDIAKSSYFYFDEIALLKNFGNKLYEIYKKVIANKEWIFNHPNLNIADICRYIISSCLKGIKYIPQEIPRGVSIELLEWRNSNPSINFDTKFNWSIPEINAENIYKYIKEPCKLLEDFDSQGLDPFDISFNYIPYKMDSSLEVKALKEIVGIWEMSRIEVYYNGYKQYTNLDSFYIETPYGRYTPDFLILKRNKKKEIIKIIILETKGEYYNEDKIFIAKEGFVREIFLKYNTNFKYHKIVDTNYSSGLELLKDLIKQL